MLIVLGTSRWTGKTTSRGRDPGQDRLKLLDHLVKRLSIPRTDWVRVFCFEGWRKQIPSKKVDRGEFLRPHIGRLVELVKANRPCSLVGMGALACECLEGTSILKKRAGTCWKRRSEFGQAGVRKVWIAHSPEQALYKPDLVVSMTRVIAKAAAEQGIEPKIDYSLRIFDWEPYLKFQ